MADPTSYEPGYSFSGFQANSPTSPLPASKLDAELANAATASASAVDAIKDVRRADGALQDNIVTYDSLAQSLQLTFDPTNGEAVAAAVATAQAAATAASGSATAAGASATSSASSAAAAAASAGSVNLSLYLSKAGNLAGIGSADTARGNISAMKTDASDATGRLAPGAGHAVTDWNTIAANGYYSAAPGAANAPDSTNDWLVHVLSATSDQLFATQIAYNFNAAIYAVGQVLTYRRHSYNSGGTRVWTPWVSNSAVSVGAIVNFAVTTAPPGYVKLNGALLSRTTYASLWNHASASGNIVSEASWSGGNSGAFSTGDLSTTFRLPDARGEFMRWYDDSRGVDSGRVLGANQADAFRSHTHTTVAAQVDGSTSDQTAGSVRGAVNQTVTSSSTGGTETRPRNVVLLACIKY